eukprot:367893_1
MKASVIASAVNSLISLMFMLIVCVYGWKSLKRLDYQELKGTKRIYWWLKTLWILKKIYLTSLLHIFDVATDVGIIVDWGYQAFAEKNGGDNKNLGELDMMVMFLCSLVAWFLYRFISAGFVYEFTGKFKRAFIQFLDLEIYNAIYITHKLGREEAGNLQRLVAKFEATFEAAPMALLQLVYIVKTSDYTTLIMLSITLSFISVIARYSSDEKIFFRKEAEGLGFGFKKRCPKFKNGIVSHNDEHPYTFINLETYEVDDEKKYASEDTIIPTTHSIHHNNQDIQIKNVHPHTITIRCSNDNRKYDKCIIQTTKINPTTVDEDLKSNTLLWDTSIYNAYYGYECTIDDLEPYTHYMIRVCYKNGENWDESEPTAFTTPLFRKWQIWGYIGFNSACVFRHSFRLCDICSRLMILGLIWCVFGGSVIFAILLFEMIIMLVYAPYKMKYNFFKVLVATYFSEDDRLETLSYYSIRKMESVIYLICVSCVVLFGTKYNDDSQIDCWKDYCQEDCGRSNGVAQCNAILKGYSDVCDCQLSQEVLSIKILLMLAWVFDTLSGSFFVRAFNVMRTKFGTTKRNVVAVLKKRDWEAFFEMLQFGYRMNRFDAKTQRSGLTIYLDRIPSDKFNYYEIERMVQLGANINDTSLHPKDENDMYDAFKVGDNVLIRYIKVTPCETIDKQFDDVVKKWTTEGIIGGDYSQDLHRITLDINAKNANEYSAFRVYWEKLQYKRRVKLTERNYIEARMKHIKKEHEDEDEDDRINKLHQLKDEAEINKQWFKNFYHNLLKW